MKLFKLHISYFGAFALLLAACGGGGGGGSGTPAVSGGGGTASVLSVFAGESTGLGTTGSDDGTGTAARFNAPNGVVADSSGNLYVTDTANFTIRKITPSAVVTTFAGTAGMSGTVNDTGAAARFNGPEGIAIDSLGNLYVGDLDLVRKITPSGEVSSFAGSTLSSGTTDGTGAAASFGIPRGVATDSSDNVYVADTLENNIRMITPAAEVTTIAGPSNGSFGTANGTGAVARFNGPAGIAVDSTGNIYVADTFNHTIRKITLAAGVGTATTFAGTALMAGTADGTGANARFAFPHSLSVDSSDNLYVADFGNSAIRKVTPAGVVTTVVGVAGLPGFTMGPLPGRIAGPFDAATSGTSLYFVSPNFSSVFLVTNRP